MFVVYCLLFFLSVSIYFLYAPTKRLTGKRIPEITYFVLNHLLHLPGRDKRREWEMKGLGRGMGNEKSGLERGEGKWEEREKWGREALPKQEFTTTPLGI